MVLAEIFISAALQVLFDRLTPHARSLWDLARREGLEKKLEKLEMLFRAIKAVLADAEEKQFADEAVQVWLDNIKELSSRAEDVLDEFAYEALRQEVCAKQRAAFTPSSLKFKFKMRSKIDDIASRLEEISKRKDQLRLVETVSKSSSGSWQATPTTALPYEAVIYGRDGDKAKIINLLLLTNEQNYDVIPIVGMAGTGKTTLIQHVCRDEAIAEAFKTKAWVCVSDDFEAKRIMKAALEDLTRKPCQLTELQPIQDELARILAGKRFLLVLDDMWDYTFSDNKWSALTSLFRVGAPGSKVIVTTRQGELASKVSTIAPHTLNILSDDDCWLLFKTHVPEIRDVDMNPDLELLRKKINERCKGLPLAARILGCLIARKPWDKWQDVIDNKIWIEDKKDGILPVLKLSYLYLPEQLKKCFAYCAILPQDYGFTEKELVRLWAAEGLIQQTDGNKHVYEVGSMYFHELVSRSIFLPSASHDSQFIMHDLVHDLAQHVAGDTCLRLEIIVEHGEEVLRAHHDKKVLRAHHLYYPHPRRIDSIKKSVLSLEKNLVRTFLSFPPSYFSGGLTNNVLHQLLKLKKLRVLSLKGYKITELPNSIGDLKHLRYLDLSRTEIICLPETTCSLYNLQTLLLVDCGRLKKLPSKMENLINLCYLDIMGCDELNEMPIGLKELKSLQELPNFLVSKGDGYCGVQELMNWKDLHGTLCISNLKDVVDANDDRAADLKEKKLDALVLDWGRRSDKPRGSVCGSADVRNVVTEKRVLDMLQPSQNLKKLTIKNYAGNVFSKWLGVPSLISSMTLLKLEFCKKCTCLPPLGQLSSLKVLEIRGMEAIQSVGAEFYGSTQTKIFPSLESLTFDDMSEWENWTCCEVSHKQVEVFSCLSEFYLYRCPKLSGKLPNHLPLLEILEIKGCEKLNVVASRFPELCELEISQCPEFGGSTIQLRKVEYLKIDGDGCEELISRNLPCTVEDLSLINCTTIERLPITLCKLKNLRKLFIENCSNLVSLPNVLLCSSVLEEISIKKCDKLRSLVNEVEEDLIDSESLSASVLKKLHIFDCKELEFVAKTLPASLTTLEIKCCNALKFVAETFLEDTMLVSITVIWCKKFERLPEGLNSLSHLQAIKIEWCSRFLSFPQGGLPSTNLTELEIWWCENLEALPNGMCNLTSLRCLWIVKCPCINNFVAAEGFLANLVELGVGGDNILRPLMEWPGFDRLTCLKDLGIYDDKDSKMIEINFPTSLTSLTIGNFPMLVTLPPSLPISLTELNIKRCPMLVTLPPSLPISLTKFEIWGCENLEYLSKSSNCFQNLTSLTHMVVVRCPKLKSLPKEGLPPSLNTLNIWNCRKLKSLPKEGLPPSLTWLTIHRCPMLEERCRRDKEKDWPKIANIPDVSINGQRP